jgi:hypothetical protein
MSTGLSQSQCCGVKEITQIQQSKNSKEALQTILAANGTGFQFTARKVPPKRMGQVWFTQVDNGTRTRKNYGVNFAKFLINQKLGTVVACTKPAPNPNYDSRHQIRMWIWTPSPARVWKWWQANGGAAAAGPSNYW